MASTALVPVEFHGATLYAVTIDGVHHVALKPISDALGLDWSAQFRRIKRHAVLAEAIAVMATPSDGGEQSTITLPLDKLNGWLFGVSVNRVKPELREKLIQYQRECFDVLARHFLPIKTHERYKALPGDTLTLEQQEQLRNVLERAAEKLPRAQQGKFLAAGWGKLKRHTGVPYRQIPQAEHTDALSLLARHAADWELVDEAPALPHQPTVNEIVADWVKKIEEPNGYPTFLFMPLVEAVQRKQGTRPPELPPGQMLVDRKKLAAVWVDLGKLRSRIDAMGCIESDFPPSWWVEKAISPDAAVFRESAPGVLQRLP